MKARMPSSHTWYHLKRRPSLIAPGIAFLLAFLSGVLLYSSAISGQLITIIINIGLDPLRTQLLAALVLTAGAAFIGATFGQHKEGTLLGAETIFCFGYLAGFTQLASQPVSDPGGRLEPLNHGVLIQTMLSMLALAFLSAFVGAAVGAAFRDVVLDPPVQLVRFLWRRFMWDHEDTTILTSETPIPAFRTKTGIHVISSWCYVGLMIVCVVLA